MIGPSGLFGARPENFVESNRNRNPLCTSTDVLQEGGHVYLPVTRVAALDAAMSLIVRSGVEVWPLEYEDVTLARQLHAVVGE